jgi:cytochrome b561
LFHVHQTMAALFLATIGVHIAAALYHHFVRKDQVLAGMLPTGRMPRGGAGGAP